MLARSHSGCIGFWDVLCTNICERVLAQSQQGGENKGPWSVKRTRFVAHIGHLSAQNDSKNSATTVHTL